MNYYLYNDEMKKDQLLAALQSYVSSNNISHLVETMNKILISKQERRLLPDLKYGLVHSAIIILYLYILTFITCLEV